MKSISVKLPDALARWLEEEANVTQRSRSAIVRDVLEMHRDGNGTDTNGSKGKNSIAVSLAKLGGFFNGPRDLSTNSKHLDDYGR